MQNTKKRFFHISVALTLVFFLGPALAYGGEVTLAWDANTEPDLAGYKIYYGTATRNYSHNVDAGNVTEYTVTELQEGVTYYFAATAYDYSDNESDYSDEIVYTVNSQNHPPDTPSAPSGPTSGYIQIGYSYTTSGSDPDGDLLEYRFDWDDGQISAWGGASLRTHAWSSTGNFCVKSQAKDSHGATSDWSQCLNVSIGLNTHTISASAGANGTISPSGSVTVNHGASQTFSINPNQNYHVADVLVDGASVGAVTSYSFNNVSQNYTISASFALDNQPPTANAGADQTVEEGATVTLNGQNSQDPGGSIVSYLWEQTAGKVVMLANSGSATASFTAPDVSFSGETLTFKLTVEDNGGLTDADYCTVHVTKNEVLDSDGDGVPDDKDAFPDDPYEWLDTDNDGIGNNADEDDDNDGMPDEWELRYGLDPLVDDASEDPDGDGAGNLDEYLNGTDPTIDDHNSQPERPQIVSPLNDQLVGHTPMLQTDGFYDPDSGDVHSKTQWQIFDEQTDICLFDIESASSLTSLQVPKLILDENSTYYWKVRFYDNHGAASDWSDLAFFMTDLNDEDSNGNGILDHQEVVGPTDMDKDGIPDSEQDDIKCVTIENGTAFIGISIKESPSVVSIDSIVSEDPGISESISRSAAKPKYIPFGLINFKLLVNQPGDEVLITVYLSERAPKNSKWYKFDPIEGLWADYSEYAQFSPNRRSITLILQDGGIGDADGIENGIIVDPSGIGASTLDSSDDGSDDSGSEELIKGLGSGCFISTAAHPSAAGLSLNLWREIRGRGPAVIFLIMVLIYAGKAAAARMRRNTG